MGEDEVRRSTVRFYIVFGKLLCRVLRSECGDLICVRIFKVSSS